MHWCNLVCRPHNTGVLPSTRPCHLHDLINHCLRTYNLQFQRWSLILCNRFSRSLQHTFPLVSIQSSKYILQWYILLSSFEEVIFKNSTNRIRVSSNTNIPACYLSHNYSDVFSFQLWPCVTGRLFKKLEETSQEPTVRQSSPPSNVTKSKLSL